MRVTLYMASTPNGFIARADDSIAWSAEEWREYTRILKTKQAYIIGHTTYTMMKDEHEFAKIGNPRVMVLSSAPIEDEGDAMFATSPTDALAKLEARGFNDVLVGGGAQCNAAFLKAGLVDEIILDIEPILFGHGLPLFSQCALEVPLELIEVKKFAANEIQLRYKVIKELL